MIVVSVCAGRTVAKCCVGFSVSFRSGHGGFTTVQWGGEALAYCRVSTPEHNVDLQHDALVAVGCWWVFTDHVSGPRVRGRPVPAPGGVGVRRLGVAGSYLTLRLERTERHSGLELIDPDLPLLAPVAWHERRNPGVEQLAWLTRSQWLCRRSHWLAVANRIVLAAVFHFAGAAPFIPWRWWIVTVIGGEVDGW